MSEFETKGELVHMALVYAIQDRESMLGCLSDDDEYRPQVKRELKEFRAYLKSRFGRLTGQQQDSQDVADGKVRLIGLDELRAMKPTD